MLIPVHQPQSEIWPIVRRLLHAFQRLANAFMCVSRVIGTEAHPWCRHQYRIDQSLVAILAHLRRVTAQIDVELALILRYQRSGLPCELNG